MPTDENGGHFDDGKSRVDLIDHDMIFGTGRALGYGAGKYGDDNFRGGIKTRRVFGSLVRHLYAGLDREDDDIESGLCHLDHAGANLSILYYMLRERPDLDDRWRGDAEAQE